MLLVLDLFSFRVFPRLLSLFLSPCLSVCVATTLPWGMFIRIGPGGLVCVFGCGVLVVCGSIPLQ